MRTSWSPSRQARAALKLGPRDTVVAVAPFAHVMGFVITLGSALTSGATVVTLPRFAFEPFLELVERHRATVLIVPPPVMAALAGHPAVDAHDLSSLEFVVAGGAPVAAEIAAGGRRAPAGRRRAPRLRADRDDRDGDRARPRAGTSRPARWGARCPAPSCAWSIRRPAPISGPASRGELWVRGPQTMAGYLGRPDAGAAMIDADGWLRTGDLVVVDDDGQVFIVDRLKELIKVNALQVAPAELEALLVSHPAVADAAVVARPDGACGEVPVAVVVAREALDADELMAWVAGGSRRTSASARSASPRRSRGRRRGRSCAARSSSRSVRRCERRRHSSRHTGRWHVVGRPRCRLGPTGRCSFPLVSEAPSGDVKIRPQVYKDSRPAEHFDRFHERTRTRSPDIVYEIVRLATTIYSWILFRVRGIDAELVPPSGAVILAPNHSSFMDHFLIGASIRRKVQFMAKSQLFKPPMQFIYTHGGVFPVRRGHRDEETFITALTVLDGGGCVAMYCEGGRSRTGRIGDTARPGIGRLALESGAPIVPVAVHGSSRVRNWRRLQFPTVTVQYGEPFRYERIAEPTRDQQQAVADAILGEIRTLYDALEAEGRAGALAGPAPRGAPSGPPRRSGVCQGGLWRSAAQNRITEGRKSARARPGGPLRG